MALASWFDRVPTQRRRHGGTRIGAPECWFGVRVGAPERRVGVGVCLDLTFQDAGGRLTEVVDKDPAWRQIPPGGQFCEKIGGIIVFSGEMMQLDPLEFVLKLVHLLAVCYHEGAFARGLLHDLVDD